MTTVRFVRDDWYDVGIRTMIESYVRTSPIFQTYECVENVDVEVRGVGSTHTTGIPANTHRFGDKSEREL